MLDPASLRLTVFAAIFAAMALWEWLAPLRQPALPRWLRWSSNLALLMLGNLVVRLVLPIGAAGFATLAQARGWGLFNLLALPDWLAMVLALVLLDLAIYFQHRLFHAVPLLWRMHRVHHADTGFDFTTALRFHPFEIALSMAYKLALIALLGPSPLAVLVFEMVLNGAAMFNHGNVSLPARLERGLRWLIVTPDMHRIHHSVRPAETNSNYGFSLSCWDRWLGTWTERPAQPQADMPIGIEQFRTRREAWLDQLLIQPFRRGERV